MAGNGHSSRNKRLADSAYNSPYTRAGAPSPHPNTDPYAPLRAQALATLEGMGYNPDTMAEHGVVWAEDQDPFGHVMQSQYMRFLGLCFHRTMESYADYLDDEEYDGMIKGKTVVPLVRKYDLTINRQVKYPDALIVAFRQGAIEPTRNSGTTSLFSLKQQAIVAEVKGSVTYVHVKSGRPVDIRTLGGGWTNLFEGFTNRGVLATEMKDKWEKNHPSQKKAGERPKL